MDRNGVKTGNIINQNYRLGCTVGVLNTYYFAMYAYKDHINCYFYKKTYVDCNTI